MGAGHAHGPSPDQVAKAPDQRRRLALAFSLIFGIVVAQGIGAWLSGSLALLTDMVHSFTDSMGLLVALVAAILMLRPPNHRRTWGFRRIEIIAGLVQALLLFGVGIYALLEGLERWQHPPTVDAQQVLIFALIGLALNVISMFVLAPGRGANFNMKAAFLEVAMDALTTLAVVASAILTMTTGYQRADTIAAFVIAVLILPRAGLLVRDTIKVLMEFTPEGLDLQEVRAHLLTKPHVLDVHDLHASTVATGLPTLSAHVVLEEQCFETGHAPQILAKLHRCVTEHFDVAVHHATFQLETTHHHAQEPHGAFHA